MQCQILCSWENIINFSSTELAQRVVKGNRVDSVIIYFSLRSAGLPFFLEMTTI